MDTLQQFRETINTCKSLFLQKTRDYGTAWRILRLSSITDQLYIKALRIRSIEEKGEQKVSDPVESEFVGLVNYSIMALMQLSLPPDTPVQIPQDLVEQAYEQEVQHIIDLLANKNHDYDEAWRKMRISSMTDLILQKLLRIKQIEDNQGVTIASEGLEANYRDIVNYSVFALIRLQENQTI